MDADFSTRSIFMKVTWHAGNEDVLMIALYKQEKTRKIALNSTAHIEEIEWLEGKKSSFEDILVFFQRRSGKRPSAKDHSSSNFSIRFSSTSQFTFRNGSVYFIFDCGFTSLHCLIERV